MILETYMIILDDCKCFRRTWCTVSRTLVSVCETIIEILGPQLIKLPQNSWEMREKVSEFDITFGRIQTFGYIVGTHIPIKKPLADSQGYFNYKPFFFCKCDGNL